MSIVPSDSKQVTKLANVTTPVTSQLSLPVNDDRCLHTLLAYLYCCDVVPQSVESPADEGRLPIKAGPHGGQAMGRGPQKRGPESIPQRLSQSCLTYEGKREEGNSYFRSKEDTQRLREILEIRKKNLSCFL